MEKGKSGLAFPSIFFENNGLWCKMEAFSKIMYASANANLLKGFFPLNDDQEITDLQFADDRILFYNVEEDQLRNIKAILLCFESASGFIVNFFRSELIGTKVNENHLQVVANLLGAKLEHSDLPTWVCHLPTLYWSKLQNLYGPRCSKG